MPARSNAPPDPSQLMQQGNVVEAIAAYRQLIVAHPKVAENYAHLATAYRNVGLGTAARRVARRGVDLDPMSADAHASLASELERDSLGRLHGADADRRTAVAEYRKALAIDPKHRDSLVGLARILSHDERGRPTEDQADRAEAISLWRRDDNNAPAAEHAPLIAMELLFASRLTEAEAAIRALPESKHRSTLLVAAIAAARGAMEAQQVASSLRDGATIQREAVGVLVLLRRYDLARALMTDTDPAAKIVRAIVPVDATQLDPALPATPAVQAILMMLGDEIVPAAITPTVLSDLRELVVPVRDQLAAWRTSPRVVARDVALALFETKIEGSPAHG